MSNEWEGFFAIKIISILALNVSVVESDFGFSKSFDENASETLTLILPGGDQRTRTLLNAQ